MAMAIESFDIDADGVSELITGWSSGKIDARNPLTGEIVFKCHMDHSVAGLTHVYSIIDQTLKLFQLLYNNNNAKTHATTQQSDYKMDGIEQLICCSVEGEIRGYKATPGGVNALGGGAEGAGGGDLDPNSALAAASAASQEAIRDMSQRKHNLMLEMNNLEEATKPSSSSALAAASAAMSMLSSRLGGGGGGGGGGAASSSVAGDSDSADHSHQPTRIPVS